MGTIYLIINRHNGHKYVGKTTLPMNKVWQQHIQSAMRMSGESLHKAMRKYGNHNFIIKQIDECNDNLLDERYAYSIDQYKQEYNNNIEVIEENDIKEEEVVVEKKKNWGFHNPANRGSGETSRIEMFGINIETGEERTWESARAAAEEVAGDPKYSNNILNAADKGWRAYGYRWRRMGRKRNKKRIYGVHKITWEKTIVYSSIREVIRINGGNSSGISKSLKNPHKYTWRGYYWFYE